MIDFHVVLRDWLKQTGTALYAVVVDRVYADPPGLARSLEVVDALSFSFLPGSGEDVQGVHKEHLQVEFRCWSDTPQGAFGVAQALEATLEDTINSEIVISGVTYRIDLAQRNGTPEVLHDPHSRQWWFALSQYEVFMRGVPVG